MMMITTTQHYSYYHRCLLLTLISLLLLVDFASSASKAANNNNHKQHHKHHYVVKPPKNNIDWDSFGFGLNGVQTNSMWFNRIKVGDDETFSMDSKKCLLPMNSDITLSPASTVLNYGQSLFEGMKAFRTSNGNNRIVLFRPDMNAKRMQNGAKAFLLPKVPTNVFINAAIHVIRNNIEWIPPIGKGSLYLRPILFGSGAYLGVGPSPEAIFCIYASPVGNYFKGGTMKCIHLYAVKGFQRSTPGIGCIKAGGNYAPAFQIQKKVRATKRYDEMLCLDSTGTSVEEAGASNFFTIFHHNRTIITPSLYSQTILPGITRQSIIELIQNGELDDDNDSDKWTIISEGDYKLTLDDLELATEAFCCGTGACITPVGSVSYNNDNEDNTKMKTIMFGDGKTPGPITKRLYKILTTIQSGGVQQDEDDEQDDESLQLLQEKYKHWIHIVEP